MKCNKLIIESNGTSYGTSIFIDGKLLDNVQAISFKGSIEEDFVRVVLNTVDIENHEAVKKEVVLEFTGD